MHPIEAARRRGCTAKRRYGTRKQAKTGLGRLMTNIEAERGELGVYRCPHGCGGWHIGHVVPASVRLRATG